MKLTFKDLYEKYNLMKSIKLINGEILLENIICDVVGFYLYERNLQMLILEYNAEKIETEKEFERAYYECDGVISNRLKEQSNILRQNETVVERIREIVIDNVTYKVNGSTSSRIQLSDCEDILNISRFLEKGWEPKHIGEINLEDCFLSSVMFEGQYDEMPNFAHTPKITIKNRNSAKCELIEQPITLNVGKEYTEKIFFKIKETNEEHWLFINNVSVVDMLSETMKNFKNPNIIKKLNTMELKKLKADTEKRILDVCPKGMGFLSLEYESDIDEQIEFYSKEYLENKPVNNNNSTTFFIRPDKKTGKLGKPMRTALIYQPLDLKTKTVDAEIFSMYKTIINPDITLKP